MPRIRSNSDHRPFTALTRLASIVGLAGLVGLMTFGAAPAAADGMAKAVKAAHGADIWQSKTAFEANITVEFGGNRILDGHMITDTPVGKTRFELKDGTVLVFDGQDAWKSPADSAFQGTRFHVLTWPYFLAAPMKVDDPGTHLADLGELPFLDGRALQAGRLTFGEGVGDSPEDWYILYTNPKSHRLEGMAYIVTFSKSAEEAEKEPHAIVYSGYQDVDGVQISTHWKFFLWNEEQGVVGAPIGEVVLSQPRFVEPAAAAFVAPEGAEKAPVPNR